MHLQIIEIDAYNMCASQPYNELPDITLILIGCNYIVGYYFPSTLYDKWGNHVYYSFRITLTYARQFRYMRRPFM